MKRILVIQGHPDGDPAHFCHALGQAYAEGARAAGHTVETVAVAALDFPVLRSKLAWEMERAPAALTAAQDALERADHIVLIYPLWLGSMPALLKAFLEQVLRPGFAFPRRGMGTRKARPLLGKSARIIVTMGMPGPFYRWFYRAHSLKAVERNILGFIGVRPIGHSLIGSVEATGHHRERWLRRVRKLGQDAR